MPLGSRGSVVTTSGLPHGQRWPTSWMARGSRPSWAATAARSAGSRAAHCFGPSIRLRRRGLRLRRVPGQLHRAPLLAPPGGRHLAVDGRRVGQRGLGLQRPAVVPDHDVRRLARHQVAEAGPGLRRDVRRVVPAALLALELVDVRLPLRDLGLEVGDVGALLQVGPHRGGVGDREQREHQHQDQGPAGEPRAPTRLARRPRGARSGTGPPGARTGPVPGPRCPPGREPRGGVRRLAAIRAVRPGSGGTRRRRRSARRRRARPRCAGAGCTWRPARSARGHRS